MQLRTTCTWVAELERSFMYMYKIVKYSSPAWPSCVHCIKVVLLFVREE